MTVDLIPEGPLRDAAALAIGIAVGAAAGLAVLGAALWAVAIYAASR